MSANIKLLIVDDEPATRTILSEIFGQVAHSVRTAKDGFSALQQIGEAMPDILLSDLNMPGMSGFELLSVVRRRFPGIYAIAMSGAYAGEDVPCGVAADAFYEKGTGFRSLLNLTEEATAVERLSRRDLNTPVPVWIPLADQQPLWAKCVMICCPECMRAFSHAVDDSRSLIHETSCKYCQTKIHYAVVHPLTSQPYQTAPAPMVPSKLPRRAENGVAQDDPMVA